MADLRSRVPGMGRVDDAERAQLVLVTALIIGVALVALVLLVNAAIYTENLATRDPDVGDEEALAYESTVIDGVGGIMDRENANEYDTYEKVSANVTEGIAALNDNVERSALDYGVTASINESTVTYAEGRLIRHSNESRNFTAGDDSTDWTLAENVSAARNHVATIHEDRLVPTTASNASSDGAFHVVLDGGALSDQWHAYVYENQTTNEIAVAVKPGNVSDPADAEEVCSVDATNATIDFTAGTIDGEDCLGLNWGESIPNEYDLEYANADKANGTYDVTVRGTDDNLVDIGTILMESEDESPRVSPAVYSAEFKLRYRSTDLEYRRTVRVARGEPDA